MQIKKLHSAFIMPTKATDNASAFDIYMPEAGTAWGRPQFFSLGFAAAVPIGHVGLLLPRSSVGARHGVELNNTCGVIDADYRGEWKAVLQTKSGIPFKWAAGDRVLQVLVVPIANVALELVETLPETARGEGGFGSSGA